MVNLIKKNIGRLYLVKYGVRAVILLLAASTSLMACNGKSNRHAVTGDSTIVPRQRSPHYDLSSPQTMTLGEKLREISGIAYISDHLILGENDEHGKIFNIDPTQPDNTTYPSVRFADKDDYEDIVVVNTTAYLLISDGEIVEVPDYAKGVDVKGTIVAQVGGIKNEFESLYYDKALNSLIMLCKSCHHEKNQIRTAFRFDLASKKITDSSYFKIPIPDVAVKMNQAEVKFYPSGAAIHPILNKLYIVSSIGKLLVVTDLKGKVEEAYPLDPALYRQPEGITFAPNGDMFISNEGGDGKATLLKFVYKP